MLGGDSSANPCLNSSSCGTTVAFEACRYYAATAESHIMPSRLWGITPGINAAPRLVLALAVIGGAADFTGMAQADDGPPRRMLVRLDSDLLVPLIERPIEEAQAVDEMILGVRMIGKAQVTGHPKITLEDDPKDAAFSVTITGTINSRTTGRNGPVQIYSRSTTRFVATKRLTYQPGRGFVGETAEIVAQTSSQPERLAPNRGGILGRAIERRAWVRAAQSREQVNQIVQAKAEEKLRQAFDRVLEARLARLNQLGEQRYLVAAVFGVPRYDCWDDWRLAQHRSIIGGRFQQRFAPSAGYDAWPIRDSGARRAADPDLGSRARARGAACRATQTCGSSPASCWAN